ncbi:hypothetical protein BDF19DRAFT_448694 [Syncephalis fuscata]|nr:hypothetical protein BDF19DRAFT_448694 [Syncephalis fuscata]
MISKAAPNSIWLAVIAIFASKVAGQAAPAANSTTNSTASSTASSTTVDISNAAQRIYNPPEEKYSLFKLRQWTQKNEDKAWCMSAENAQNIGENILGIDEQECAITSANQQINYWEVVEKSHIYMIRFSDPKLCLTAVVATQKAGKQVVSSQTRIQRRSLIQEFHDDLFHGGRIPGVESKTSASTNISLRRRDNSDIAAHKHSLKRRINYAPNDTKQLAPIGPTIATPIAPVNNTSKNATANGSAVAVKAKGVPMLLSQCIGRDNQLFQMKLITRKDLPSNYYQIMSYQYKLCIASERKSLAAITLVPCADNDESQLWLLEDVKKTIKALDDTSTMVEYANSFQIKDYISMLGLGRNKILTDLTPDMKADVNAMLPGANEVFEMAYDLADYVRTYANNIKDYLASGTVMVSKLVNILLTPVDRPSAWEKIWNVISIIFSFLPLPPLLSIIKGGVQVVGDYIANTVAENRKNQKPSSADLAKWDLYALEQADIASDMAFNLFTEMFQKARIGQLREELANFKAGKYAINANAYYKDFQIKFSQQILLANTGRFWIAACASTNANYCKGNWGNSDLKNHEKIYNEVYTTNLPDTAVDFLENDLQERNNFYEGKNGWALDRHVFTCPSGTCRERLILRSGSNKFEVV